MNLKKLFEVYEFAKNAHDGQKRRTGGDYITHPIAVAKIASNYGADEQVIHACLLHDVVEDTNIKLEEIAEKFGQKVAFLVYGVTKAKTQEKTFEKIEVCLSQDERIIFVKLADRIHNTITITPEIIEKYKISNQKYIALGRQYGYEDLALNLEKLTKALP
ncbi:MAG: HD domain-containing protein [Nanoarchaeota archaeon]|nr:HD domain-containing protein [Nanoarchaeota archaeon]